MKIQSLSLLLVLTILLSCQNEYSETTINAKKIKFDPSKSSAVVLQDIAEDISFKVLSTDNNFFISSIDKIYLTDSLIIIPQNVRGEILIFDMEGKPKRKMNLLGPGPGQILSMSDTYFNKKTQTIDVLDKKITKIFSYDLTGKFLKEVRVKDYRYTGFRFAATSDLYVFERFHSRTSTDRLGIYDNELKYIQSYLTIPKPIEKLNYLRDHPLESHNDSLFYLPLMEDKIYYITKKGAQIAYEFDLPEKYRITKDFIKENKFSDIQQYLAGMRKTNYLQSTDQLYITDDYIYFSYKTESEWKKLFYSRKTAKVLEYTIFEFTNAKDLKLQSSVVGTNGEYFVNSIHAFNNSKLPKEIQEKLTINSNPVLLFYKLKKF